MRRLGRFDGRVKASAQLQSPHNTRAAWPAVADQKAKEIKGIAGIATSEIPVIPQIRELLLAVARRGIGLARLVDSTQNT
jgi:hypothetical protein